MVDYRGDEDSSFTPTITFLHSLSPPDRQNEWSKVKVKRIRNREHQTLETLINEETQLFAKYLRGEAKSWVPRVPGN